MHSKKRMVLSNSTQSFSRFLQSFVVFRKAKPKQFQVLAIGMKSGNGNGRYPIFDYQSPAKIHIVFIGNGSK